jgi:NAD-dependent SIR2 family protein deacetylase
MTKQICQYCGWEVPNPDWYNYLNQKPLCDDCNMDMMVEKQRELENA